MVLAGIVATQLPGAVAVTSTWNVHWPSATPTWAGTVPPARTTVELPGVADTEANPQVPLAFAGLAMVICEGNSTVTWAAVSATSEVLASVIV